MKIDFDDTKLANAPAQTLFEVLTDYQSYPSFNSAVVNVTVVKKDETGAAFVADMKSKVGKQAQAFDRYKRDQDLNVERTYDGMKAPPPGPLTSSMRATFILGGTIGMSWLRGVMMKPLLKPMVSRWTSSHSSKKPNGAPGQADR